MKLSSVSYTKWLVEGEGCLFNFVSLIGRRCGTFPEYSKFSRLANLEHWIFFSFLDGFLMFLEKCFKIFQERVDGWLFICTSRLVKCTPLIKDTTRKTSSFKGLLNQRLCYFVVVMHRKCLGNVSKKLLFKIHLKSIMKWNEEHFNSFRGKSS